MRWCGLGSTNHCIVWWSGWGTCSHRVNSLLKLLLLISIVFISQVVTRALLLYLVNYILLVILAAFGCIWDMLHVIRLSLRAVAKSRSAATLSNFAIIACSSGLAITACYIVCSFINYSTSTNNSWWTTVITISIIVLLLIFLKVVILCIFIFNARIFTQIELLELDRGSGTEGYIRWIGSPVDVMVVENPCIGA